MKILYVVSRPLEINTSASIRNAATISGLIENGHSVDLLTTKPDPNHSAYDASLSPEGIHRTEYIQLGGIQNAAKLGRKLRFLAPLRGAAYRWISRHEVYDNLKGIAAHTDRVDLQQEGYDVIISSSDPKSSHLFVEKLLKTQGKDFRGRWIQIWGDPFLGDITRTDKKNTELIRKEEQRLLAAADKIVYVSRLTLDMQQKTYPKSGSKMVYFPIPYLQEKKYALRDLSKAETLELAYCGDYNTQTRSIYQLYEAMNSPENKKFHLTLCGFSDAPVDTTDHVTAYGRLPHDRVQKIEEGADILVHLSNLSGSQIPGKIYQYSGTNKPILFILDGETELLKSQFSPYGRYSFTANDPASILKALQGIINANREEAPVEQFSKVYIANEILH